MKQPACEATPQRKKPLESPFRMIKAEFQAYLLPALAAYSHMLGIAVERALNGLIGQPSRRFTATIFECLCRFRGSSIGSLPNTGQPAWRLRETV